MPECKLCGEPMKKVTDTGMFDTTTYKCENNHTLTQKNTVRR